MVALLAPHFDLPFRISSGQFACVEQDSYADISNCVEAVVRTPQGTMDYSPDFGLPELEFVEVPINTELIVSVVNEQEPRAVIEVTDRVYAVDQLIDHIKVQVG